MKKTMQFLVALTLAVALAGAAWAATIDATDGATALGGPSLNKVHVVSVPLKAPIASSNTYVLAELPVGAVVLGCGVHSEGLSTNATATIYSGSNTTTCATSVSTNLTLSTAGTPTFSWDGGAVTAAAKCYGVKTAANVTAGTVYLDLLVMEP